MMREISLHDTRRTIAHRLSALYDSGEANALTLRLLEAITGHSTSWLLAHGKDTALSPSLGAQLESYTQRLLSGQPLQYLLGWTEWAGHQIEIAPGVLIPRPETEELVEIVLMHEVEYGATTEPTRVLDLGTGSGCIAYALAQGLPKHYRIDALELSEKAATIAQRNFHRLAEQGITSPQLILGDMLSPELSLLHSYDIWVSNPPYIHPDEATQMHSGVLDHEPTMALFAPSSDPLTFYKAIAQLARRGYLKPGGRIYLELNPLYAEATESAMQAILDGLYHSSKLLTDLSGKLRFLILRTQA